MASAMPELRTPVMILVDVSWQDQSGTWQNARLRMEDKSAGGACIRSKIPIEAGSKIKIHWRFDQFAGVVKYCRKEDREYLIGIQRGMIDADVPIRQAPAAISKPTTTPNDNTWTAEQQPVVRKVSNDAGAFPDNSAPFTNEQLHKHEIPLSEPSQAESAQTELNKVSEFAAKVAQISNTSAKAGNPISQGIQQEAEDPIQARDGPSTINAPEFNVPRQTELRTEAIPKRKRAGKERKSMAHKWLQRAPWNNKPEEPVSTAENNVPETRSFTAPKESSMPQPMQSNDKASGISAREVPAFQVELLPMEDIYRTAGIVSPRKGYSVTKVVEMLNSEHVRDLSKETKRAALLMALDAAGVSIEQVQRDAKSRQSALDAYEAEQKKQAEAEWTRKAEEIAHIQAELESIKAHYSSRISRNMEALARDKARFNAWVTTKEQESQSMAEAVELCIKTPISEPANTATREPGAAAAAVAGSAGANVAKPL